jgi:hypothetical protein
MAKAEADMERDARVVSLLEDNVRTELQVANDMLELGLSAAAIEGLMEGVTSGLLYAFAVDWSPDWVKPGQVDDSYGSRRASGAQRPGCGRRRGAVLAGRSGAAARPAFPE